MKNELQTKNAYLQFLYLNIYNNYSFLLEPVNYKINTLKQI